MQPVACEARDAYETFAPLYDLFTAGHDYEGWTAHLERALLDHGLQGRDVLDVACGTGKSFLPFLRRGYRVTACDLSPRMVAIARAKARDAVLFVADARRLPKVGQFDLVMCLDDSLNYLLDTAGLEAAVAGMRRNLRPDGLCLFDLNTLRAYRTTFADTFEVEAGGVAFTWHGNGHASATSGCSASALIETSLGPDSASVHEQRHFSPSVVRAALAKAGLEAAGIYGQLPDGSLSTEPDELVHLKLVYVARPQGR